MPAAEHRGLPRRRQRMLAILESDGVASTVVLADAVVVTRHSLGLMLAGIASACDPDHGQTRELRRQLLVQIGVCLAVRSSEERRPRRRPLPELVPLEMVEQVLDEAEEFRRSHLEGIDDAPADQWMDALAGIQERACQKRRLGSLSSTIPSVLGIELCSWALCWIEHLDRPLIAAQPATTTPRTQLKRENHP